LTSSELINKLYSFKESFDLCTSLFNQLVILDYLKTNNLKDILKKRINIYKKCLAKTLYYLNEIYKKEILFHSKIKGGLYIHIKFKNKVDNNIFTNINKYYLDDNHENETRINICNY